MKKRKAFVSIIAALLAGLMLFSLVFSSLGAVFASAASQSDLDALEQQKTELSRKKQEKKSTLNTLKAQQADFMTQKAALDEQSTLTQQEINVIEEQIQACNDMIAEKESEAQAAQESADAQLELYKDHLRAMEENGTFNFYLSVLFGAKNFSDLLSRMDMISEVMENDQAIEDSYKQARDFALDAKAEYEDSKAELGEKQTELQNQIQQLKEEIQQAGNMIASLQNDIDAYTAEYNKAAADEQAVNSQISTITQQLKAQEEANKKANETSGTNTPVTPGSTKVTGSFVWPSANSTYVTSKYGYRIHPIFGTKKFHSGIDIGAAAGTAVLAADGGTVSVATYSSSYGNYVMIYHADGTTTLYAHMSSLAVSAGQTVSQGSTIGYVGETGWAKGPHLHFEVRKDGATLDPLAYFSNYSLAPDA